MAKCKASEASYSSSSSWFNGKDPISVPSSAPSDGNWAPGRTLADKEEGALSPVTAPMAVEGNCIRGVDKGWLVEAERTAVSSGHAPWQPPQGAPTVLTSGLLSPPPAGGSPSSVSPHSPTTRKCIRHGAFLWRLFECGSQPRSFEMLALPQGSNVWGFTFVFSKDHHITPLRNVFVEEALECGAVVF